ncbi:MAG: hybrid sensor histidine kinase/response regulator [Pseudozobellia sp.]|nr:hybrid sensor histidine kinase/response regulator [Pseudozobellia sp.]MBG49040.1 hybrid sensor histidine kinase/response regulator [Pseudozobellia sp.]
MKVNYFTSYFTLLYFVGFLVSTAHLQAQSQISFRQLSVKEGLSQNSAIAIGQDSTGYLYVATQDGLNKYDGRSFEVFPYNFIDVTKPDYSHLGKVYRDRQENLWIIPIDGIPRKLNYKTGGFQRQIGVGNASVVFQDVNQNVWFGTFSDGLYKLDGQNKSISHAVDSARLKGTIYNIAEDSSGHLLIATDSSLVEYHIHDDRMAKVQPTDADGQMVEVNISDVVIDRDKRQWVGTFGKGLYQRKTTGDALVSASNTSFTGNLPNDLNITDLFVDSKDRLWLATYGDGAYLVDIPSKRINHFKAQKHDPKALHYDDILNIYEDATGTIWFGTDGAGLSFYDEFLEKFNSITNLQTPDNVNVDVVRALAVSKDSTVFIGTSGKGLTEYRPKTGLWRTYEVGNFVSDQLSSDRIMSLHTDADDDLWIGTQGGGLTILDKRGEFKIFHKNSQPALSANTIWCIFEDRKRNVWLGTREQGLILFDKKEGVKKRYTSENFKISSNNIRAITSDSNDNLWIGTESDGLLFYDSAKDDFKSYQSSNSELSNDNIKSLYFDPKGILWIGTNGGGLNALDIDTADFTQFTVSDGLANNVIYGILPDEQNNLWLSSNKGITRFAPSENLNQPPEIINYTNYDGLATEFNTGAYYKHTDGTLYFGGLDGFYWFKPSEITLNQVLPKTTITQLEVLDEYHPMGTDNEFAYDQNTVSFTFSSLQFSLPEKNQYRYRLLNFDEDWVESKSKNFARYTRLPPGKYTFQVVSSNYDGLWNDDPASFDFTILSPWYLTSFAKFIYILFIIISIIAVYKYMAWRLRMKMNLQRKEEEADHLKKLNELKSKLYTDISHEFRTPLTLIAGPVDETLDQEGLSPTDHARFSMIKRNANRMLQLVEQLLQLSKIEEGNLKLVHKKGELSPFLSMVASSFEYQADKKGMDYKIEIDQLGAVYYDEDALEKIVTNLLSNAFKYGESEGVCIFRATKKSTNLHLQVRNTITKELVLETDKWFERFFQKDHFSVGAGVGLSLVKELVNLYKGDITVNRPDEDMIEFEVVLPIFSSEIGKSDTAELSNTQRIGQELQCGIEQMQAESPILLIAEDQNEVRRYIASLFENDFNVYEANNGDQAFELSLKYIPDIIISDVRMPVASGLELCNRIKADERTSHIPIVLLTAGVSEEEELRGLGSGADDFISKPFNYKILNRRVLNLIQSRRLVQEKFKKQNSLDVKGLALTSTDENFLKKAHELLKELISDPEFNAGKFAQEMGMSRMQLHRKLQTYTGLSTTEFIRSQRLRMAAQLLTDYKVTVNEVAYSVGFNTPSYFIKCFKEAYGKTPAEYLS